MKKADKEVSEIEKAVMTRINSGSVKMHSRLYYSLLTLISLAGVALLAIVLSYLLSLTSLWIRLQTASSRAYGARQNLTVLVENFPWWAVALVIIGLISLIILVRKMGSIYKVRLVYLIPAIITLSILIGYGLSYTHLPNTIKGRGQHGVNGCSTLSEDCQQDNSHGYRGGR